MSLTITTRKIDINHSSVNTALVFANESGDVSASNHLDKNTRELVSGLLAKASFKPGKLKSVLVSDHKNGAAPNTELFVAKLKGSKKSPCSEMELAQSIAHIASKILAEQPKQLYLFLDAIDIIKGGAKKSGSSADLAEIVARELIRASYQFSASFGKLKPKNMATKIIIAHSSAAEGKSIRAGIVKGKAIASGINFARELGNLPGNYCAPRHLADFAKEMAKRYDNLNVKVLGEKAIEKLKMGSFLSVGRGSAEETKFIIFEYKGKATAKPNVLVGKGITFDTGGISLKPGSAMDEMKFDMCGAASVFGTITALAEMKAKVHVVGLVAAAENMPSSKATKPGDVVTSMSGQTIEILNTDAEGRLVLCDALTYAERYKPKSVIDIATLTGACIIALGKHASGLFSNDQKLADKILESGQATGDRAWQLPIWDSYQSSLKSNFADMANIGGREAGSITAACFLSKFAKAYPWAHLDIAGSAWKSGAAKGATGRPVELLVHYLLNHA